MYKTVLIAVFLLSITSNIFAAFYDGNQLVSMKQAAEKYALGETLTPDESIQRSLYVGYIYGVADSFELELCGIKDFERDKVVAIVSKYLDKNASYWNWPADLLVQKALKKVFPCKELPIKGDYADAPVNKQWRTKKDSKEDAKIKEKWEKIESE